MIKNYQDFIFEKFKKPEIEDIEAESYTDKDGNEISNDGKKMPKKSSKKKGDFLRRTKEKTKRVVTGDSIVSGKYPLTDLNPATLDKIIKFWKDGDKRSAGEVLRTAIIKEKEMQAKTGFSLLLTGIALTKMGVDSIQADNVTDNAPTDNAPTTSDVEKLQTEKAPEAPIEKENIDIDVVETPDKTYSYDEFKELHSEIMKPRSEEGLENYLSQGSLGRKQLKEIEGIKSFASENPDVVIGYAKSKSLNVATSWARHNAQSDLVLKYSDFTVNGDHVTSYFKGSMRGFGIADGNATEYGDYMKILQDSDGVYHVIGAYKGTVTKN